MSSRSVGITLNEWVRASVTDDGLVILDIVKGEIHSANIVAARIWRLMVDEGKTEQEAVDAIVTEFEATRETVERDTRTFVDSLMQKDIVKEKR
jgi:hypothetical protein